MAVNGETMEVFSVNCRGLQDKLKCQDVINYLNSKKPNIICLQDTHLTEDSNKFIKSIWNDDLYINGNRTNARGVCTLIKKTFEYEVLNIIKDINANLLVTDLKISNDFTLRLINIYAPNRDEPDFFEYIETLIEENPYDHLIICGDFNLVLNATMDTLNYTQLNNPHATEKLKQIIQTHNLLDIYRHQNPDKQKFTWTRRNPRKLARLYFFLVNIQLLDIISNTKILPGYRTDHSIINLSILLNKFSRGICLWKLNCSLLKNQEYLDLVNTIIIDEKKSYAIPVYNPAELSNINEEELIFTISDKLFLETLLLKIRGETIKFSSNLKKRKDEQERKLINDIESIENNTQSVQESDILEDKKNELEDIRIEKMKGEIIRSRAQWLDEGERPTKFFCKLENRNYVNKTIKKLIIEENNSQKIITDQESILKETKLFYKNLFSNKQNILTDVNLDNLFKNKNVAKLTQNESKSIEGPISLSELSNALKK